MMRGTATLLSSVHGHPVPSRRVLTRVVFALFLLLPRPAAGQTAGVTLIDAPEPPLAPATVNRDAQRRATLRAVRLTTALRIDGRLDDEVYRLIPPVGDFIQQVPKEGAPATEATDLWVLFDDNNLYISLMCHETHPERRIAAERRRDGATLSSEDNIILLLDTFYDRRNAFLFQTNANGAVRDQIVTDGVQNVNWNTVWDVKTAPRAAGGYSIEFAIPFKSLRYRGSGSQVWGINVRRALVWKNEVSFVNPMPVSYGLAAILQLSTAAALVGLETPAKSLNLEMKPYAISSVTTDRTAAVPLINDGNVNAGIDFKYGITRGLTADVTVNTDFAQVEEDVQQVNLTRFSLFFPEKRDFFLEGQGMFGFAGQGSGGPADGNSDVPTLFFSRRIGLSQGQVVPVRAGARLSGRVGQTELGLLNVQTADKPNAGAAPTSFSVARVRRNILRRSNVGVIATVRQPAFNAPGSNVAYGADANLRFYQNVEANLYAAATATEGRSGDDASYRARFAYAPDRYGLIVEHLKVGRTFNPDVGFVRRPDFRTSALDLRFSPRPTRHATIRQLFFTGHLGYITNASATQLSERNVSGAFTTDFHSSNSVNVTYTSQYEFIPAGFSIATGVQVPRGGYDHSTLAGSYRLGTQYRVSGTVSASHGTLYGGRRTTAGYRGRVIVSSFWLMEPSVTINRVRLPFGDFSANLFSTRVVLTPSPWLEVSSLLQLNPAADTMTSSVRMRWEYTPGSQLFVVYTDGRTTADDRPIGVLNRTLSVKVTRLIRF